MSNKVGTWFSRIKNRVNNLFTSKGYSFSKENDEFYQKTMKRFGEWNFSKKNLRDKQKILNEIADDGKDIQIIGIIDGYRGQNPGRMKLIVRNVASLWQSFIESTFKNELIKAKSKAAESSSYHANLGEKKQRLQDHQTAINSHYNLNSKNYSLILGAGYVIISIFLIQADFPLSIQVVQQGFNIGNDTESVNLALGIVLITIYFKIFYDEYLGTSVLKTLLNSKPEYIIGKGNNADLSEMGHAKKIKRNKLISKLVILTLLIFTLYSMGIFRSEFMAKTPGKGGAYQELMESPNTKYLFILLSIMFPIIGGICASIGINTLQNIFDRYRIWFQLWWLNKKITKSDKRLSIAHGLVESCQNNVNWADPKGNFIEECASYFFSYYLHGYEWGLRLKMPEDFYEVAEHMRTHEAKINSTKVFFEQMAKSTESFSFHNQFYPNNLN